MSSLNCFKPPVVGNVPHKPLEGSSQVGAESSDSDIEDYDNATIRDRISFIDDIGSLQSGSRFQSLRSESPRPEPNVLLRTLKTASLSSRNKPKLKSTGGSYPSPMLICMKGHSRKSETLDSRRKFKTKRESDVRYDNPDSVDLCKQPGSSNNGSLSCLVRSHSDSTCLAVKAGQFPDVTSTNGNSRDLQTFDFGSDMRSANGSNCSVPRGSVYSPIYPNTPTPSFGYIPPSPFMNYDTFFGTPQLSNFIGIMTPSGYGTPNMSLGESGYQGVTYPSPQLSSYSFMFQCPQPYTDLYQQQQRPCSIESCPINGGPISQATAGPRSQNLDNYRISGSPMPPIICPQNYPRQNHSSSSSVPFQQTPISMEERAPAAPVPARRLFGTQHHHPMSPNPPAQRIRSPIPQPKTSSQVIPHPTAIQMPSGRDTAFKRLNTPGSGGAPPSYNSVMAAIGDPTHSRGHHQSGSSRQVISPAMNSTSTSQTRSRNPTPSMGPSIGGGSVPSGVKKANLPSHGQHPEAMYQLPEFVSSPPKNLERSPKQSGKLERLRREKHKCEQLWQMNKRLESENTDMENQIGAKERELKSCNRRAEDLSSKLGIIRRWCEWLTQPPGSQLPRPDRSPYFETDEDSTRWKRAFDELCRLDQKIGNLQTQRRLHPTAVRLTTGSANVTKPPPTPLSSSHLTPDLPPKPSNERYGRHSSAGNHKRDFTPIPSPRLNRPASAPVDEEPPIITSDIPDAHPPPPPRPALPSPSPLLHQKARFASRKEITATYLTPPQRRNEHSDEYKRTASENLQAQLASQQLLLQNNSSIKGLLPEAKRLSVSEVSESEKSSVPELAVPYFEEEEEEEEEEDSASTSSGSADTTPKPTRKVVAPPPPPAGVDGSEDSAIGDTDGSPIVSQESPKHCEAIEGKKPILRKDFEEQPENGGEAKEEKTSPDSPKTGVRFHPLALLLDAALEGDLALVKKAAEDVSDVSEANDEGITALHNAVCAGRSEVVEFLVIEAGADVNAGDTDGWTPLHCAASCANLPLARLLVEHGAALHARTLSDHETALEKCDQADADAECQKYLSAEQDLLGSADNGRVYALFPRGPEAAGPGSPDANIEPDELPIWPNEELRIIDRAPAGEPDWMLAEKVSEGGTTVRGLVPRAFISRFRIVRVPPASHPMPLPPPDAVGKFARVFQSPSPIEEESEDSEGLSDSEIGLTRGGGSPQMVERDDNNVDDDDEAVTVEENSHEVPNGKEVILN
ncbi:hypothetical protein Aperf_G00000126335 [Anoplocephala perfoliata]